jgi:cytochrome c556
MKIRILAAVFALITGAGYTVSAFAQAKPETLVEQRQAVMILHGKYFNSQLRPMAQGKIPYDANVAARNAGFLDALSKMPWDGFDARTKAVKSRATPAVFAEPDKFKKAQDQYQSEVAKLLTATKSGDEAAVKAQINAVNKACNACHDDFRESR